MPSPVAHSLVGYVIQRTQLDALDERESFWEARSLISLLITLALSLAPDADSLVGLAAGDLGDYHNTISHSLIVGLGVAIIVGLIAEFIGLWAGPSKQSRFGRWFVIALLCYESHVIMDFFAIGRGVMLFWPLSGERFSSPLKLFYGLRWSDGWLSVDHVWTVVSELGLAGFIYFLVALFSRREALLGQSSS
jgi:inner membrane protein